MKDGMVLQMKPALVWAFRECERLVLFPHRLLKTLIFNSVQRKQLHNRVKNIHSCRQSASVRFTSHKPWIIIFDPNELIWSALKTTSFS